MPPRNQDRPEDILSRPADLEQKAIDLDAKAAELDQKAAELELKNQTLETARAELDRRALEIQAELEELKAKPAPPARTRKTALRRFICVRKCYHWIAADKPETRRIFMPGEEYLASEGEQVPRHFMEVTDKETEADAKLEAERAGAANIPAYLAKKQRTTHG